MHAQAEAGGARPRVGASAAAIQHHYDLDARFWKLCLDEGLTYSCALWHGPDDDLATAQARKLDYIAGLAHARRAGRVLDVGCGWGSMLERLVGHAAVGYAVGLTLSPAQAHVIRQSGGERREVRLESWAQHEPNRPYDAIVSIGAFEHFARPGLARAERVDGYREFFSRCRSWLAPGGYMGLQTIVKGQERPDRRSIDDNRFIAREIFPDSDTPWLAEIVAASEGLFEVAVARDDGLHYARTCAEWLHRLRSSRDAATAVAGSDAVARHERYFAACVRQFERRHAGLVRISLRRVSASLPRVGIAAP